MAQGRASAAEVGPGPDREPRNFGGIAAALFDLDDLARQYFSKWIIAVNEVKGIAARKPVGAHPFQQMIRDHRVAKTKIANSELEGIVYERMKAAGFPANSISIAIVPSERHGWTALISPRQRKINLAAVKKVEEIQKQLRATYDLKGD